MHRYLRAIGFSNQTRKEMKNLVIDSIRKADRRNYTLAKDNTMLGEFSREYAAGLGITAAGAFDEEDDQFHLDYYFPYLEGTGISSQEEISVERHASQESYAGVCDDIKVGISMIFYLQNKIPYVKAQAMGQLPIRGTTLTLSALSVDGSIILPVFKLPEDLERIHRESDRRVKLISEARTGNEDAIEMLTLEDMDTYTNISRRILREDIFSIVDTSFMPYGVECDQYAIVGEICHVEKVINHITEEKIYKMDILCNEIHFDLAINELDLQGEPAVGRRFKGIIWLQGRINFPEEI